jgi:hypothetical protein
MSGLHLSRTFGTASMATFRVVMFQSGRRDEQFGLVNRATVSKIKNLCSRIETPKEETEIDLWLDSPGGDANAAFKLWHYLRSRCSVLRAVVPGYAKSAATLLSIGCDQIYMADDAELGPLDVQIEHPDREGVTVSGLDVAKALQFLNENSVATIISAGQKIYQSTELPRREVLREVATFSAAFMQPLVAKLDPHLIHKASNELAIAQRYAEHMLTNRRPDEGDEDGDHADSAECDPWFVAHYLVHHYPAHDFFVSCSEARELGLPIKRLDEYSSADVARILHTCFERNLDDDGYCRSVISIIDDDDIVELRESENETEQSNGGNAGEAAGDATSNQAGNQAAGEET